MALQCRVDGGHIGDGVDLWDNDAIGPGSGDGGQVVVMPWSSDAVGPDGDLSASVATSGEHRASPLAGLCLGIGCHGILKVEDEGICGDVLGLLQGSLVGRGHVEHAAARAQIRVRHCQSSRVIVA